MEARALARLAPLACWAALACSPSGDRAPEPAPPPATRPLAGGGRLVVHERPDLEHVEGSLRFVSGRIREPDGAAGLADVLADALYFGGPLQLTGAEFHERLLERDATVVLRPGAETVSFDFTCPPGELDETLAAVAQLLTAPAYPAEFVERARARIVERLEREADDAGAVADRLALDLAYGPDAPHTRRPTFDSVEAVTREAVLEWHARNFVGQRLWAGLVGPVTEDAAAAALEEALAGLDPGAPAPLVAQPALDAPEESRVIELLLPRAERAELRFVAPGVGIAHPDYAALRLWSDAVAGAGARTGAFFAPRFAGGELFGFASGSRDVLALLAHLDPQRFPAERLEDARARVLAAERERDTPWGGLDRALDLARHGLSADFWERHRDALRDLDAAAVAAAAGRHLPAGGVRVVAVHPGPPLEAPLPTETQVVLGPLRGTPEGVDRVAGLLERLGGRARWAALDGLRLAGEIELGAAAAPVQVEIWRDLAGRRLRLEQTHAGGSTAQVVTPEGAFSVNAGAVSHLSSEVHLRALHREERYVVRVLRDLALGRALSARLAGERLQVLRAGTVLGWFEPGADGLPARWVVPRSEHEELYATDVEEWVEAGGYVLPSRMRQVELGRAFRWSEVEPNPELDATLFSAP